MGVLRPAGPLPARVYWFRRLVVVGIPLLLVVVVVWVLVGRGGGNPEDGAATDAGQDAAPATDATEPEDDTPGIDACDPQTLGLTLAADGASYAAGALPTFTVTLSNDGTEPCLIDVGEAQREIVITSGTDRIWSSRDCAPPESQVREILLTPGTPDVDSSVQWGRVRSAQGCPADQAAAQPGTYAAALTLGPLTPEQAVFVLE